MTQKKKRSRPLASLVRKPLMEDKAFLERVDLVFEGLEIEQKLIKLRKEQKHSQSEFAKLLGVSQPLIAKMESQPLTNIELKKLVRVVTALNGTLEVRITPNGARKAKTLGVAAGARRTS